MPKYTYPRQGAPYPPNGYTGLPMPNPVNWSTVYYLPIMGSAQIGLGDFSKSPFEPFSPPYVLPPMDPSVAARFQTLVSAIGTVIGVVAAHETGHQLSLPNMECDDPDNPYAQPCQNGDIYVYNYYTSDGNGATWDYLGTPKLKWSEVSQCALERYLLPQSKCQ